jgi:iron-sulfur cluster assembly accessory protein
MLSTSIALKRAIPQSLRYHTLQTCSFSTRLRDRPAPITITERAASRIKELLSTKEDAVGVKLGVRRRGCNGYSYTMNYANSDDLKNSKDELVTAHGVKVFVDPKAIFFVVGTQMDFVETELSSEFTFQNPNSKGECGCGESFNV